MPTPSLRLPRCPEIAARLSEFLDDELDETARHEVARHLAICEGCASFAAELAATIHAVRALRREAAPDPVRFRS